MMMMVVRRGLSYSHLVFSSSSSSFSQPKMRSVAATRTALKCDNNSCRIINLDGTRDKSSVKYLSVFRETKFNTHPLLRSLSSVLQSSWSDALDSSGGLQSSISCWMAAEWSSSRLITVLTFH